MQRSSLLRWLLALALAAAAVLALSSCGKDEPAPTEPDTPPAVTEEEPVPGQSEETSNVEVPDLSQDILSMHEKNDDVVGWLNIPDTTINNAVLQAEDNKYYERLDENRQYSFLGSFFADYECDLQSRDSLSKNTVIYGHNVQYDDNKDGERFSQLFRFTDQEFAEKHPYVYFSILGDGADKPENQMVWEIFAVFYTTTDFPYIQVMKDMTGESTEPITDAQLSNLLTEAQARSEYDYPVTVSASDKILTLSTCSYKYGLRDDVRFVVMARLLEPDASLKEKVDLTANADKKTVDGQ